MKSDRQIINQVLQSHDAGAMVAAQHRGKAAAMVTPTHTIWRLIPVRPGVTIAGLRRVMPEIQSALSRARRDRRLQIRLDENMRVIEVPSAEPKPIILPDAVCERQPEFTGILGCSYEIGCTALHTLNLADETKAHVLIAGTTGSGKTQTQRTLLATMAYSTSPEALQYVMIDLKGIGLRALQSLPHVRRWTANAQEAAQLIEWVRLELQRRIDGDSPAPLPRIVLVVDELTQLEFAGLGELFGAALADIATRGRELGVHLCLSAQNPSKGVLGAQLRTQISTKIVGHLEDSITAYHITGRRLSGAESLPGRGAMLLIDGGNESIRFQAYLTETERLVGRVQERWRGLSAPKIEIESTKSTARNLAEDVKRAQPIFNNYVEWQVGGHSLKRGGRKAIVEAVFGEGAYTGGTERNQYVDQLIQRLAEEYSDAEIR